MRKAISLISVKDNAILLLLKRDVWILPGGKPNAGESDLECLSREIAEELPKATVKIGSRYGNFEGLTPHHGDMLQAIAFLGTTDGDITPGAEITKAKYFHRDELSKIHISDITEKIIARLVNDCLLN